MSCETSICITEKVGDSPVAERALQQQEYLLTDFVVATQVILDDIRILYVISACSSSSSGLITLCGNPAAELEIVSITLPNEQNERTSCLILRIDNIPCR
jgi:hypothetical protein